MVCNGNSHFNGWLGGTPILGNLHILSGWKFQYAFLPRAVFIEVSGDSQRNSTDHTDWSVNADSDVGCTRILISIAWWDITKKSLAKYWYWMWDVPAMQQYQYLARDHSRRNIHEHLSDVERGLKSRCGEDVLKQECEMLGGHMIKVVIYCRHCRHLVRYSRFILGHTQRMSSKLYCQKEKGPESHMACLSDVGCSTAEALTHIDPQNANGPLKKS